MTQFSWPWACDNLGDGGSASYTLDVVETTTRIRTNLDPTSNGVIYWTDTTVLPFTGFVNASDDLLAPTNPSGNTIRIASGLGLVQGWLYANDDNVDFDASGAANATDIIVLRRDRSAQTVRLALVQAGAGGTATVTQTSATWEVLIATIALDGSGNVSTLTDSRTLAKPPVGSMAMISSQVGVSSPSFTVPPLFDHYRIIAYLQSANAGTTVAISMTINGDSGANYDYNITLARNSTVSMSGSAGANNISLGAVTSTAGSPSFYDMVTVDISGGRSTAPKVIQARSNTREDGTTGASGITTRIIDGWYSSAAQITQIDLSIGGLSSQSVVNLYGIVSR